MAKRFIGFNMETEEERKKRAIRNDIKTPSIDPSKYNVTKAGNVIKKTPKVPCKIVNETQQKNKDILSGMTDLLLYKNKKYGDSAINPVETIMNIDLNQFAKEAYTSAKERQENGANISVDTLKMLKHTATEVIEATEAYSVEKYSAIDDEAGQKEKFASELADIIACVLIIAHSERIDINEALVQCLYKNKKRAEMTGDKL